MTIKGFAEVYRKIRAFEKKFKNFERG